MNSVHKYPRHDHDSSPPLPSYHRRLTPSPLMLTSFFSLGIPNLPDSQVNRSPVFLTLHGPHLAFVGLRITIHNTVEGRDIISPLNYLQHQKITLSTITVANTYSIPIYSRSICPVNTIKQNLL